MLGDAEDLRGAPHRGIDVGAWTAGHFQAKAHVLRHGHVWIKCVVLKHHRNAAIRRLPVGDIAVVDDDPSGRDFLEPRDDAKQRRLPAAGWSDHDDELARIDRKTNGLDGAEGAVVLCDIVDDEARHCLTGSLAESLEAFDEVFLREEKDHDDRQNGDRESCHDRRPVRGVHAHKLKNPDRQRL